MIAQADSRKWMACLYNSFLFMEAKIMKMAKKLLAVVLTGVMAVSMLTGCALSDKVKTNALVDALNYEGKKETTVVKYEEGSKANDDAKSNLATEMSKAREAVKKADNTKTAADVESIYTATNGYIVIVKEVPDKANKKDSWGAAATAIHTALKDVAVKGGSKKDTIVVDIDFVNDHEVKNGNKTEKTDFVIVVAKKA
jgi:hypothetical protein